MFSVKNVKKTPLFFLLIAFAFFVFLYFLYFFIYGREFIEYYYKIFNFASGDLYLSLLCSKELDPYNVGIVISFPYPALIVLLYYFLSLFINLDLVSVNTLIVTNQWLLLYAVLSSVHILLIYCLIVKISGQNDKNNCLNITTISLLLFLSYPFLLGFERCNSIILSFILVLVFLAFYQSENKTYREIALISLAVSANIKLYPALFGLLLIGASNKKVVIRTIIYGIVLFFVPFVFLKNGFRVQILNFLNSLKSYQNPDVLYENISLLGIVYTIFGRFLGDKFIILYYILLPIAVFVLLTNMFIEKKMSLKVLYIFLLMLCFGRVARYVHIFAFIPIMYILNQEKELSIDNVITMMFVLSITLFSQLIRFKMTIVFFAILVVMVFYVGYKFIMNLKLVLKLRAKI